MLATRADGSAPVLELVRRMDAEVHACSTSGRCPRMPRSRSRYRSSATANLDVARQLVREAEGSPLFLIEMTRYLQGRSLDESRARASTRCLSERIDELGEAARLFAEIVAVAGEPIDTARARRGERYR